MTVAGASSVFGSRDHINVNRGIGELTAGRPMLVAEGGRVLAVLPVEGLDDARLAVFRRMCVPEAPRLVVTAQRANALGLVSTKPVALALTPADDAASILGLTASADVVCDRPFDIADARGAAALRLAKLSYGLPAVLAAEVTPDLRTLFDLVTVEAAAVGRFHDAAIASLVIASEAAVPLNSGAQTRFVIFRDAMGASPVAIVVGKPDMTKPVPVRLHSACLTGDVFGSRRCDCGDQLKIALSRLDAVGGGVILYLPQEGRGLGLANKMRTYQMQENGLDTVDANTTLGFDDDERDYGVAARILEMLNCRRVVMLTNNPAKLDGLSEFGIDVVGRMALEAPIHADNVRYLTAKAERAGHRLDHLMASLAEMADDKQDAPTLTS